MVETGGLENRFTFAGNGGSNPSPSATDRSKTSRKVQKTCRTPANVGVLVLSRPVRSDAIRRCPGVILISGRGYFPQGLNDGTDRTPSQKTKPQEKPYRLSDSGGLICG